MDQDHYLVVLLHNAWQVSHRGVVEGPFRGRDEAIAHAVARAYADAQSGTAAEVLVQQESDRSFALAWKYGRDPNPQTNALET